MDVLTRIPELACPACGETQLEENENRLMCCDCGQTYNIQDGIPNMLCGDQTEFAGEISVQGHIAHDYETTRYQQEYARRYHELWINEMLSRVSTDGRILDNGCGVGILNEYLPSERIVGLDISRDMLWSAAKRSNQLVLGNSQRLPFRVESFDFAFCRGLLHHLPEPELAVREIHRVLKPKGEVILADTNASLISTLPRILTHWNKKFSETHENLNYRIIRKALAPYFHIDEVFYFGYIAYPLLGYPDLTGGLFNWVPVKMLVAEVLMAIDNVISRIPLVRTQSWCIIVKATRRS